MDLGEAIRVVSERYKLCPNRIWQVSSRLPGWESILPQLLEEFCCGFADDLESALRHENHTACTLDYCEFSTRNFTTVKQYHELGTCEKELNAVIRDAHIESGACFPLQGLFQEQRLLKAINSNRLTAWSFDGCSLLQFPQAFMAISHVWSDGTGAGKWSAKGVNRCLYDYFQGIARQFQCEGIWWDTICIPKDRRVRGKAMKAMQLTYEYAKITLVHDRFLRNLPYRSPRLACIAVIMSSWFTRGWTALELVKSRKVKIVFKDCIVDLDEQILHGIDDSFYAAGVLRNFRKNRVIGIENLVTILGSRYTSWAKDQATIAGLLAGVEIPSDADIYQRDIYQRILRREKKICHGHLFHQAATMSAGFSWCPTSLLQLPHATGDPELKINETGEVAGLWRVLPVEEGHEKWCIQQILHPLTKSRFKAALENRNRYRILAIPAEKEIRKVVLAKLQTSKSNGNKSFKCQFMGSLNFHPPLHIQDEQGKKMELTIGGTESYEQLEINTNGYNEVIPHAAADKLECEYENYEGYETAELSVARENSLLGGFWHNLRLHHYAWVGDLEMVEKDPAARDQIDGLGQLPLHLAAERGSLKIVGVLLEGVSDALQSRDANGQIPLHRASWGGSIEVVELLIREGSNLNAVDNTGNTALHIAAEMGFYQVAQRLIAREADVISKGKYGLTPLHYAALGGHHQVVQVLVNRLDELGLLEGHIDAKSEIYGWTPLHCATYNGNDFTIRILLHNGAQVNQRDDLTEWTPMHFAAMAGHTKVVELLLEKNAYADAQDRNGWTALNFAAINGHLAIVELLFNGNTDALAPLHCIVEDTMPQHSASTTSIVEAIPKYKAVLQLLHRFYELDQGPLGFKSPRGYDVLRREGSKLRFTRSHLAAIDPRNNAIKIILSGTKPEIPIYSIGNTAHLLHWAAGDGSVETVILLLQLWSNPNAPGSDGSMPLVWAAENRQMAVFRLLTERGARINAKDNLGNMLLHQAAKAGKATAVEVLIEQGANLQVGNDLDETALILATRAGHESVVRLLVERGAYLESQEYQGETALISATRFGHESVVRFLAEQGAKMEAMDKNACTPLMWAIYNRDEAVIGLLLESGADVNATHYGSIPPLVLAAMLGYNAILQVLLNREADIEVRLHCCTPLLWAAGRGHEAVIGLLFEYGADIEARDLNHHTPLIWAAINGHEAVVELMLAFGADIEARDLNHYTPLFWAAGNGHQAIVQLLLGYGADIEARDLNRHTPLLCAAINGHDAVVEILLDFGADIEAIDLTCCTPLWWAARKGHESVVKLLLDKGAYIDSENDDGHTPLWEAVIGLKEAVTRLLISRNADIEVEVDGQTIEQWARRFEWHGLVQLIADRPQNREIVLPVRNHGELI